MARPSSGGVASTGNAKRLSDHLIELDRITIVTDDGVSHSIELLAGSMTALPPEMKVDFGMCSAFPGSYAAVRGTVVAALLYDLDISVQQHARDKEEDLRQYLYCWYSRPLPAKAPYNRILCFEPRVTRGLNWDFVHPATFIASVFRCLMAASGTSPFSVITPILAAGCQGFSDPPMLDALVTQASEWINTGLPLTSIKVCIFSPASADSMLAGNLQQNVISCLKQFQSLAVTLTGRGVSRTAAVEPQYDVLPIHAAGDLESRDSLISRLHSVHPLRVHPTSGLDLLAALAEKDWKQRLGDIMSSVRHVVAFLSPSFLETEACIDLFNLATCLTLKLKRNLLTPFYICTIEAFPSYMSLIQFIDCRPGSIKMDPGLDSFLQSIVGQMARDTVTDIMDRALVRYNTKMEALTVESTVKKPQEYDIFISYCHRDTTKLAVALYDELHSEDSTRKIFFDKTSLMTGSTWQAEIYGALCSSKQLVLLVSEGYWKSLFCTEEYNLILGRHFDQQQLKSYAVQMSAAAKTTELETLVCDVTSPSDIALTLSTRVTSTEGQPWQSDTLEDLLLRRRLAIRDFYIISDQSGFFKMSALDTSTLAKRPAKIAILGSEQDARYVKYMRRVLSVNLPPTQISEFSEDAYTLVDDCDMCFVFLSAAIARDKLAAEKLNALMIRQRTNATRFLFPLICGELPRNLLHLRIMPAEVCLYDRCWQDLSELRRRKLISSKHLPDKCASAQVLGQKAKEPHIAPNEQYALLVAAVRALRLFSSESPNTGVFLDIWSLYAKDPVDDPAVEEQPQLKPLQVKTADDAEETGRRTPESEGEPTEPVPTTVVTVSKGASVAVPSSVSQQSNRIASIYPEYHGERPDSSCGQDVSAYFEPIERPESSCGQDVSGNFKRIERPDTSCGRQRRRLSVQFADDSDDGSRLTKRLAPMMSKTNTAPTGPPKKSGICELL